MTVGEAIGCGTVRPPKLAIVYVHGLRSSARTWMPMMTLVRSDRKITGVQQYAMQYRTPRFELSPKRRIPTHRDLGEQLGTFIKLRVNEERVLLVTHSQGGLVAMYYLDGLLNGFQSTHKQIVGALLFACPHLGSDFLLEPRKRLIFGHAQERALRPGNEELAEVVRNVALNREQVVRDPIRPVVAASDAIVGRTSAIGPWLTRDSIDGDHQTIIKPAGMSDPRYVVLRESILKAHPQTKNASSEASDSQPIRINMDIRLRPARSLRSAHKSCWQLGRLTYPSSSLFPGIPGTQLLSHHGLAIATNDPDKFLRLSVHLSSNSDRPAKARLEVISGDGVDAFSLPFLNPSSLSEVLDGLLALAGLTVLAEGILGCLKRTFGRLADAYEECPLDSDLTVMPNLGPAIALCGDYLVTDEGITDLRDPVYQESLFATPENSRLKASSDQESADLEQARRILDLFV